MQYRHIVWGGVVVLHCIGGCIALAQNNTPAGEGNGGQEPPTERNVPVQVTMKTDKKTYRSGEPIKITMTVKNTTKDTVSLRFSSGQNYDLEIRRGKNKNGEKVWQWAEGRMFTMALTTTTLQPGKSKVHTETYGSPEMERAMGKPAPTLTPGTYALVGTVTTMGRTPRPFGTTTFTVK